MIVEELAYRISEIKKMSITSTGWRKVEFNSCLGYIKNESAMPIRFAVKNPESPDFNQPKIVWNTMGVRDTFFTIDPQETVGPLILGTSYLQCPTGTCDVVILVHEVRE